MVNSIEAGLQAQSWTAERHFRVPYYRQLEGTTPELLFRHRPSPENQLQYSIDLVVPEPDIHAIGSVDFSVEKTLDELGHRHLTKPSIGLIQRAVWQWDGPRAVYCPRPREEVNDASMAIYVSPELRRQGIGASLVSASRIVLATMGIRHLFVDEITPAAKRFYEKLGGRIFYLAKDRRTKLNGKLGIPTAQTYRFPYRFE